MSTELNETASSNDIEEYSINRHLVTQEELSDLIRHLHLSKYDAEFLASRLQQWNHLSEGTKSQFVETGAKNLRSL